MSETPLHDLIDNFMKASVDLASTNRIAVACSGGSDSMALALLLKYWADRNSVDVVALSVDHGLRRAATAEVQQGKSVV